MSEFSLAGALGLLDEPNPDAPVHFGVEEASSPAKKRRTSDAASMSSGFEQRDFFQTDAVHNTLSTAIPDLATHSSSAAQPSNATAASTSYLSISLPDTPIVPSAATPPGRSSVDRAPTSAKSSARLSFVLEPYDESHKLALIGRSCAPYLQLNVKPSKSISSIVQHLRTKWGACTAARTSLVLVPSAECCSKLYKTGAIPTWSVDSRGIRAGDVHSSLQSPSTVSLRYVWEPAALNLLRRKTMASPLDEILGVSAENPLVVDAGEEPSNSLKHANAIAAAAASKSSNCVPGLPFAAAQSPPQKTPIPGLYDEDSRHHMPQLTSFASLADTETDAGIPSLTTSTNASAAPTPQNLTRTSSAVVMTDPMMASSGAAEEENSLFAAVPLSTTHGDVSFTAVHVSAAKPQQTMATMQTSTTKGSGLGEFPYDAFPATKRTLLSGSGAHVLGATNNNERLFSNDGFEFREDNGRTGTERHDVFLQRLQTPGDSSKREPMQQAASQHSSSTAAAASTPAERTAAAAPPPSSSTGEYFGKFLSDPERQAHDAKAGSNSERATRVCGSSNPVRVSAGLPRQRVDTISGDSSTLHSLMPIDATLDNTLDQEFRNVDRNVDAFLQPRP